MLFIRLYIAYIREGGDLWPINGTADVALPKQVVAERISSEETVEWHCIALHIAYQHCCVGNSVLRLASYPQVGRTECMSTHAGNDEDSSWTEFDVPFIV